MRGGGPWALGLGKSLRTFPRAGGLRPNAQGLKPFLIMALLLAFATSAAACPVCFGDPNAPMQKGVNSGIWVLLGVIGSVQIGFVALFLSFRRRARDLQRRRESFKVIEGGVH